MLFKAVISGICNGAVNQNVIHFARDAGIWPTDGNALCQEIRDNFLVAIRARLASTQKWTSIQVYNRALPGDPAVSLPINIVGALTGNGSQAFAMTGILIRLRAAGGGRHGRGRIYLAGLEPTGWSAGVMTATEQGNWVAPLATLTNRYLPPNNLSGFQMVIAPKINNGTNFVSVVRLELSSTPGVQRRRNVGVGI